jgi:L-amino acid N-acyltransferase YncA
MKLQVREARPDDAAAIVGILNPIIEAGVYTALDTPFTLEEERKYIESFPSRGIFHVAVQGENQNVVGFQSMEPFASYTHAFDHVGVLGTYVDLSMLRRGIAKVLFKATFEAAASKGYEKIFTFVRADNRSALATYQSQGFRIVGTAQRQAKLNGKYVDEIIIEKIFARAR